MTHARVALPDLERQTQAVRARLEQDLDEIQARRARLSNAARAAVKAPSSWGLALAAAAVTGGVLLVRRRRVRHPATLLDLLAGPSVACHSSGFARRALKKAGLALTLTLARRLGERLFDRWLTRERRRPAPERTAAAG